MFLKKKDKFLGLVLKHMGTSALMDLLLRLVSCVEPVGLRQEVLHVSARVMLSHSLQGPGPSSPPSSLASLSEFLSAPCPTSAYSEAELTGTFSFNIL